VAQVRGAHEAFDSHRPAFGGAGRHKQTRTVVFHGKTQAVNVGGEDRRTAGLRPQTDQAKGLRRGRAGHDVGTAEDAGELLRRYRILQSNLLGEAVLGDKEAEHRLSETKRLLARDDVDYVSIKVSAVSGPHQHWAFDEVVETAVRRLTPLYELAASSSPKKFINLDMEEYKDLDLTIEVFTKILDQPQLKDLEAGIVLQAYLPDTLAAMQHLQEWAAKRVAAGGSGVKVTVGSSLKKAVAE